MNINAFRVGVSVTQIFFKAYQSVQERKPVWESLTRSLTVVPSLVIILDRRLQKLCSLVEFSLKTLKDRLIKDLLKEKKFIICQIQQSINQFHVTNLFLYPLNTLGSLQFCAGPNQPTFQRRINDVSTFWINAEITSIRR